MLIENTKKMPADQYDYAPEAQENAVSENNDAKQTSKTKTENKPIEPGNDQTNPKPDSCCDKTLNRLEISVFFDGTWNNRTNSDHYNGPNRYNENDGVLPRPLENMNDYKYNPDLIFTDNISYARLPTTVDRMQRAYKDNLPNHYSIYIDGCGTGNAADLGGNIKLFFADNPIGAGTGWGSTGIKSKIKKAFKQLNKMIRDKTKSGKYEVLIINVFGFSRGSATARVFSNLLLKKQKLNDISAYQRQIVMPAESPMHVQLKFMGIFDCVSSVGFNHGDDEHMESFHKIDEEQIPPSDMAFKISRHEVTKIVHLAAANEYREKFSLYDISAAVEAGIGTEIHLPGCHTDLGDGLGTEGKVDYKHDEKGNKIPGSAYWDTIYRNEFKVTIAQKKVEHKNDDEKFNKDHTKTKEILKTDVNDIIQYDQYKTQKPNTFKTKASALAQMERVNFTQLKENLVKKGFFIETDNQELSQIWIENTNKELKKLLVFNTNTQYQRLIIDRKKLSMLYPIIPANIMIEFCKKYQLDAFDKAKLYEYSPEYAAANDDVDAKKWSEIYQDLKEQSLAWDEKMKQKAFECTSEQNTSKFNPIASIEPKDEAVRKAMYNQYIHWSSAVSVDGSIIGGGISRFLQVSLGQINPETNMFERTIYKS